MYDIEIIIHLRITLNYSMYKCEKRKQVQIMYTFSGNV